MNERMDDTTKSHYFCFDGVSQMMFLSRDKKGNKKGCALISSAWI